MILSILTFGTPVKQLKKSQEQLDEIVLEYLISLNRNGQISENYFFRWHKGVLRAYVSIMRPNALNDEFHSQYGLENLSVVKNYFSQNPLVEIIDDNVKKRYQSYKTAPFLYLHAATYVDEGKSGLYRGDNEDYIPLYLLPITCEIKEKIVAWRYYHNKYYSIWLKSGELEIETYKQLADLKSELSKEGLDLCREIEGATGIPTYYYLLRYYGRREGEEARVCPSCGSKWLTKNLNRDRFCDFNYMCKKCRLVSHQATSIEDQRYARIGEYRQNK